MTNYPRNTKKTTSWRNKERNSFVVSILFRSFAPIINNFGYDILLFYMTVGGIPMYLSYVQLGLSLAQIIDDLYFNHKAKLKDEFDRLFNSIFRSPEPYKAIIRLLARQNGYTVTLDSLYEPNP